MLVKRHHLLIRVVFSFALLFPGGPVMAQEGTRALRIEAIAASPRHQAPLLEVRVDHPDQIYELGESAKVTVRTQVNGFLYLIYVHADGTPTLLFPNEHEPENQVTKGGEYTIPGPEAGFRLAVSPPAGPGLVKAFVLDRKSSSIGVQGLAKGAVVLELDDTHLNAFEQEVTGKGVGVRPGNNPKVNTDLPDTGRVLADHQVRITTVADGRFDTAKRSMRPGQRIVVAVGVGVQKHEDQFRSLPPCRNDATQFASLMEKRYAADKTVLLLDQDVTADKVRTTLQHLAKETAPGDEVILFWSGHGSHCRDDSDDETDGEDEALVTWDGDQNDVHGTMVVDDMLGRWIQDFAGCETLVIMDTCYSGGQARNEKGISWDSEFNSFTKDISEKQATVLCSSTRAQLSHVRTKRDLSVMTHFLLEYFDKHSETPVTVNDLFRHIEDSVPKYTVAQHGVEQNPVLIGNVRSRIVFEQH
jgi:hypothetical protein